MDKMTIIETEQFGKLVQYVLIDKGNGEFTSTEKSYYDKQQAEQSTPSVTNGD
jgi:hypothetical protein